MPVISLRETPQKPSWKFLASSILSPYVPKNKTLLQEWIKSKEKNSTLKHSLSLKKILSPTKSGFFIKNTKSPSFYEKKTEITRLGEKNPIISEPDLFSEDCYYDLFDPKTPNIVMRRKSCCCEKCGMNSKFEEKINKLLPSITIRFQQQKEEKKKLQLMTNSNNFRKKGKTQVPQKNNIASAVLKGNQGFMAIPMLKSAVLKKSLNNLDNFGIEQVLNSKRNSVRKVSLSLMVEKNEEIEKKAGKFKENYISIPNVIKKKNEKFQTARSFERKNLFKKEFSPIVASNFQLGNILEQKKKPALSLHSKESMIKKAYNLKTTLNFFRKIFQNNDNPRFNFEKRKPSLPSIQKNSSNKKYIDYKKPILVSNMSLNKK